MSAMVSRMRAERFCSPKPGSSISMVPMRANTSRKAAASAGRNEISMRTAGKIRSAAGDMRGNAQKIAAQRVGHERQRDQHRDENRQNFRDEDQGSFLDLGQRLQQRDGDADDEPDQHQRRGDDEQ